MQSDGSNVNLQRTDPRIAERGGGMRGMFSLAALRWCGGDSANTSQSWRPRSRNGIAHPESEKVKFIFLYICIFFLPFLSLALPYPERIETTKTGLFFFFHGDVQFTFANKKNPAWGHPPKFSLFFFFNRKRVSDVYMLKNKAANLPAPLPGIDNCHVFSPGFGAKLCIRLFFFFKSAE